MEDAHRVAVLDRVDYLQEDFLYQKIVPNILHDQVTSRLHSSKKVTHPLTFGDHAEQVAVVAKVHHDVDVLFLLDDLVQRDDVRMPACQLMKGNLSPLEMPLPAVEAGAEETFNSEVDGLRCVQVDSEVDDAVRAYTEDREELESTAVDGVADEVTAGSSESVGGHGDCGGVSGSDGSGDYWKKMCVLCRVVGWGRRREGRRVIYLASLVDENVVPDSALV